jgi:hypothetical protein|tara:strand:- start:3578 stop:3871 length:294 start_codon:yes stop_codon:yes gene_type:complete
MPIKKSLTESGSQRLAVAVIRAYQMCISSLMFNHCRFHPSCSQYAIEAIQGHGFIKGSYLTVARLLRCHPAHPGGFDPVPQPSSRAGEETDAQGGPV